MSIRRSDTVAWAKVADGGPCSQESGHACGGHGSLAEPHGEQTILTFCASVADEMSQARYANFCIPFVMLLEILVGTRLVINFRERFNGPGRAAAVVSGRYNAFAREEDGGVPMNKLRIKISYEIETMVDGEFEFDRVFGEQKCPPEC